MQISSLQRNGFVSFAALLLLLLGTVRVPAQGQAVSNRTSSRIGVAQNGVAQNDKPVSSLLPEVLGSYCVEGTTLELRKDGAYAWAYFSDDMSELHFSGTYSTDGDKILLSPPKENVPEGYEKIVPESLYIVRWGKRTCLVKPDEMPNFCNDVNLGYEPRWDVRGRYYLRYTRVKGVTTIFSANGLPTLPKEWSQYILRKPVTGRIVSIQKTGRKAGEMDVLTATLNVGARQGLREGMPVLLYYDPAQQRKDYHNYDRVNVHKVEDSHCVVEFVQSVSPHPEKPQPPIHVGGRVSTRLPVEWVRHYQQKPPPYYPPRNQKGLNP